MADTAPPDRIVDPSKDEPTNHADVQSISEGTTGKGVDNVKPETQSQAEAASPMSRSPGPTLSPLRSSPANGLPATIHPVSSGATHQKKFTHSNINKMFLEKTHPGSNSSQALSASVVPKSGTPTSTPKLQQQSAPSHSRLVTAKLTTVAHSTAGPGWSRPPSSVATPTPAPQSAASNKSPLPSSASTSSGSSTVPPAGKVIQPQPRGATEIFATSVKRESNGKSAWGVKTAAAVINKLDVAASDFPTAAEVAQGNTSKLSAKKEAAQAVAAQKDAITAELTAEADTFRGVHLDPNAHHWDEIEEDDTFLDTIIDFGDGRQYKVEATQQAASQDLPQPGENADGSSHAIQGVSMLEQSVSKEERFAEDFDRSWPRTKVKTNFSNGQREYYVNGAPPSASSQSTHSPSDSKVLFNERSNKLEPYSSVSSHYRQGPTGQTSYFAGRGSRSDHGGSPVESRGGRDVPPHVHSDSVQLLQKASGHLEQRSDGTRGERERVPSRSPEDPYYRRHDRDPHRQDSVPLLFTRAYTQGSHGRSQDYGGSYDTVAQGSRHDDRSSRPSFSHSQPHPSRSPRDAQKELNRQLPPHLTVLHSPHGPQSPLLPNAPQRESSGLAAEPPPEGPRSPATSTDAHTAAPVNTVRTGSTAPMCGGGPVIDLTEAQKKEMHSAAERARLRRQQEEQEREQEKERARKKAAELEARLKANGTGERSHATGLHSDDQVVNIIEDAVRSSIPSEGGSPQNIATPSMPSLVSGRTASFRGAPRPAQGRQMSAHLMAGSENAAEAESWRNRTSSRSTTLSDSDTRTSALPPPSLPLLAEVESLHLAGGHDVEVVDFSDLGKLVGAQHFARLAHAEQPSRQSRLGAADSVDDYTDLGASQPAMRDDGSWRRRTAASDLQHSSEDLASSSRTRDKLRLQVIPSDTYSSPMNSPSHHNRVSPPHHRQHDDRLHPSAAHVHPGQYGHSSQRSPLTPSFREAPISALDDVMSRIKGALDDMHTKEESPPKAQKWVPPALRLKNSGHDIVRPSETFDVTAREPPRSPKPAWNMFTVKLPSASSRNLPPVATRQLFGFQRAAVFWSAVYSWNPPIGGKSRVDVSVEEYLFGSSSMLHRVELPRKQSLLPPSVLQQPKPIVNLPMKVSGACGIPSAFGESETGSWRKSSAIEQHTLVCGSGLDTTSRSPPPEVHIRTTASLPKSTPTSPSQSVDSQGKPPSKAKTDQTLVVPDVESAGSTSPENAAVQGRSNDSRSIVGSPYSASGSEEATKPLAEPSTLASVTVHKHTVDHPGVTPSGTASSPWSKPHRAYVLKDASSRGAPDPEHLKAVWSQASDKAALPSVNSLKGIADDLTAVPFTIQDVKSEDGGTPPPSGPGLSRMSSYDVTRAFQQVPTPSVKSPQRSTILPAPVSSVPNGPVPRAAYSYTPSLRPAYPYPSPVLSHSPSPTVVYPTQMAPSPAPRPVMLNGPPSPYGQPMWVPMGGPQPQNPLMRPMAPPYPQYIPYPSPGPVPMYVSGTPQPSGGIPGRSPAVPMMSPMIQPPALYGGSPVMMHSPHVHSPQTYVNSPANRVQPGINLDHAPSRSQSSQTHQQPYTTNAFVARPTW